MSQDTVRVLRVIEYVGTREAVEWQIANSLHGQKTYHNTKLGGHVTIRAATLGLYPEVLQQPLCGQTAIHPDTECEGSCSLIHGHKGPHDFGF